MLNDIRLRIKKKNKEKIKSQKCVEIKLGVPWPMQKYNFGTGAQIGVASALG